MQMRNRELIIISYMVSTFQVYKFQTEKYISTDLLNEAKTVLHVRSSVQKLMKKCEDIAKDMQSIVSRIVNGEEDAGISKQPESLNSSWVSVYCLSCFHFQRILFEDADALLATT